MTALVRTLRIGAAVAWVTFAGIESAAAQSPNHDEVIHDIARLGPDRDLPEGGYLALMQAVRDARNDTRVVILASHPDDPYVLPAAFLRIDDGYRVAVVLFTRGEGGQNSTGPETGDELGRLRTLETTACARRLGLEVHYLNRQDRGFCRSASEAFDSWGRETTVRDLATMLRRLRPDIVLTTHNPGETHGHDLALLDVLPDAVALAADPAAELDAPAIPIPRVFRGCPDDDEGWFALPTESIDPDRGESFRDIAYRALTESHRSQAPFRASDEFFADSQRFVGMAIADSRARESLYEGLPDLFVELDGASNGDGFVARLHAGLDEILPAVTQNRTQLIETAFALREQLAGLHTDPSSDAGQRIAARSEALARVVLHALAVRTHVEVPSGRAAVPGEVLRFTVELNTSGLLPLRDLELVARPGSGTLRIIRPWDTSRPPPWILEAELDVPKTALELDPLADLQARETFELPLACELGFRVELPARRISERLVFPLEIPTLVAPPVAVAIHPHTLIVPDDAAELAFNVRVKRNTAGRLRGKLHVEAPPGFVVEPSPVVEFDMPTEPEQGFRFALRMSQNMRPGRASLRVRTDSASDRAILHRVPLSLPADLTIGLIEGVDDSARDVLQQLGCTLVELTESELPTRALDDLDTVLVDIRALQHHEAARAEFRRLLDFAEGGGRLVVLYHKDTEINVESTGIRFYPDGLPLHVGKGRVTREDAPVRLLLREHPLLQSPNQLEDDDWDGWTQERGLYFADEWADGYETPLELNDPGQPPERGALLYARTGEGEYVYCALALFRQLGQMHAGACRILANLVTPWRDGRR